MNLPDFVRRPISQHLPQGVNPNALDDFSEIKRQINKLSTVTPTISWKTVYTLSEKILLNESKDIRCACYYTVSATHIDGLKGLVGGLNALLDICVVYWYSAYPEENKPIARKGAIEWLTEHTARKQKTLAITTNDLALIEMGHQLTLKIEEELRNHYGIKSPSLSSIRRIFSQWIEDIQEDKIPSINNQPSSKNIKSQLKTGSVTPASITPSTNSRRKDHSTSFTATLTVIGISLSLLFTYFFYSNNQEQTLRQQINTANTHDMLHISSVLAHQKNTIKESIKPNIIQRTQWLISDWELDPIKVNQLKKFNLIIQQLQKNYPDSVAVNEMKEKIVLQTKAFNQEYTRIHQQFLKSQAVLTNTKEKNNTTTKARNDNNAFFPLLGRIEYAEKKMTPVEINKTQRLLNIYQHKINTLKDNF